MSEKRLYSHPTKMLWGGESCLNHDFLRLALLKTTNLSSTVNNSLLKLAIFQPLKSESERLMWQSKFRYVKICWTDMSSYEIKPGCVKSYSVELPKFNHFSILQGFIRQFASFTHFILSSSVFAKSKFCIPVLALAFPLHCKIFFLLEQQEISIY